jgi:hypothetical protein
MTLELFNSEDPKDYEKILKKYEKKETKIRNILNSNSLFSELEHFYKNELPESIQKNSYMTLNDLSKLMKYKLIRGKFRPSLQKKIDGNNPDIVISCTKDAIKLLNDGNWQASLKVLIDNLDGVGIATASYIGAIVRPDLCPIMSDEVIQLICEKLDYTMKCYKSIQNVLVEKAVKLNSHHTSKKYDIYWTPYLVGEVLFLKSKDN